MSVVFPVISVTDFPNFYMASKFCNIMRNSMRNEKTEQSFRCIVICICMEGIFKHWRYEAVRIRNQIKELPVVSVNCCKCSSISSFGVFSSTSKFGSWMTYALPCTISMISALSNEKRNKTDD